MNSQTQRETEKRIEKLLPFQHRYMRIANWKIHYFDEGKGPVVILFHACPMWSFSYRNLIRQLSGKYRVIVPDLLGFGLSDKPEDFDYLLNSNIDLLEEFITNLNLDKMNFVVHGWGGTIALGYAVQFPNRIRSLVIMNCLAFSGYTSQLRLMLCRIPFIGPVLTVYLNLMQSGFTRMSRRIRQIYDYPLKDREGKLPLLRFVENFPVVPESDTSQAVLAVETGLWVMRTKPVCIIWAMKDWLYNKKILKLWHKNLPDAEIHTLPHAGRYIQEDAPEELEELIGDFLKKNTENDQIPE